MRLSTVLVLLAATCLASHPAEASWSPQGVTVLSDPSHAFQGAGIGRVGADVFVWANDYGGGPTILRAQHVLPDGTVQFGWDADAYNVAQTGALDPMGGFDRVSSETRNSTTHDDVYMWRVQPGGGRAPGFTSSGVVVAGTTAFERNPLVVPDANGDAIVAYVENASRIRAKHVLANGTLDATWLAAGRTLNANLTGAGNLVGIVDGAGGAFVAWNGSDGVSVQHITAAGAIAADFPAEGILLSGITTASQVLGLVPSDTDHFLVAWLDGSTVRLQRFGMDATLDGTWPADGVDVPVASAPLFIADGSGGALVAWQSGTSILGARVQIDGTFDPAYPVSGTSLLGPANFASASSYAPAVATGPAGGFVVCWNDDRRPGHTLVRARWLLASGAADPSQPDSGIVVSPTATKAAVRSAISDGNGGVYVAWAYDYWPALGMDIDATWLPYPSGSVSVPRAPLGGELSLAAFPNPSRGEVSLRCALASAAPARLQLIDLAGRVVREREIRGAGERVEHIGGAGDLAPGVYLVRLVQQGKFTSTRVAIVR